MKSVSFHMQQQSNSPNSRNGFSIIAQLVSHLPLHPSSHTLVYKHTFSKIIARNFSFFFDRATSLDLNRYLGFPSRLSICDAYGKRGRNENHLGTLTVTPCSRDFPSPRLLLSIRSAKRFQRVHAAIADVIEKHVDDEPSRLVT